MITCRELADFLMDYVDGSLPAGQRSEFEKHLGICPACVHYLDSYRKTVTAAKNLCPDDAAPAQAPEGLIEAILKAKGRR